MKKNLLAETIGFQHFYFHFSCFLSNFRKFSIAIYLTIWQSYRKYENSFHRNLGNCTHIYIHVSTILWEYRQKNMIEHCLQTTHIYINVRICFVFPGFSGILIRSESRIRGILHIRLISYNIYAEIRNNKILIHIMYTVHCTLYTVHCTL